MKTSTIHVRNSNITRHTYVHCMQYKNKHRPGKTNRQTSNTLASTYAMWLIVSIIFLDPWHMVTSFIQYLLLTPTYINILNVYAFCNTHDITWGTKGDTKPEKLPSVATNADGKAEIEAPTDDADLNTQYEAELAVFRNKWVEEKKEASPEDKQEDYYKGFRSSVVLFWMFCNLALVVGVLQSGGLEVTVKTPDEEAAKKERVANIYLAVVLWSVAGLSAFRFIGAMWFLVVRMVSFTPCSSMSLIVLGWLTDFFRFSSVACKLACVGRLRRFSMESGGSPVYRAR
jgi:hypothetical protein